MSIERKIADKEGSYLEYKNITLEELRNSNYPDSKINSFCLDFLSELDCSYRACHHMIGSYIRLFSEDRNTNDFTNVWNKIRNEFEIKHRLDIQNPAFYMTADMEMKKKLVQKEIADIIENFYMYNFQDVWILELCYRDISKEEFQNATLPRFKLSEVEHKEINTNFYKIYEKEISYFLKNPDRVTYNDVVCECTPDEIENRQIPDIKIEGGEFTFYGPNDSFYIIWIQPWRLTSHGDFRILISGDKGQISSIVNLILELTNIKRPVATEKNGSEKRVPIFLHKNIHGKLRQENILDLVKHLYSKGYNKVSSSVTYKNLTKEELYKVIHKTYLNKAYALVKNRRLHLDKFFGDVNPEFLSDLCANIENFKYYFGFINPQKKVELLKLIIKNKKKVKPEVIDWVNNNQRSLIEQIVVSELGVNNAG